MGTFLSTVEPDAELRDKRGLNVIVGKHRPMPGGRDVVRTLYNLIDDINEGKIDAYHAHHAYETLHPFTDGNGRSGRALWLWMRGGSAPLGFLHQWYYQSLAANNARVICV